MADVGSPLQFVGFSSAPKVSFWHGLAKKKLEEWRLDCESKEVVGSWYPGSVEGLPPRMELVAASLEGKTAPDALGARGSVIVVNTLDNLKRFDKKKALAEAAEKNYDSPSPHFLVIVYADVKRHHFTYWFAFPQTIIDPPATLLKEKEFLPSFLGEEDFENFKRELNMIKKKSCCFFVYKEKRIVDFEDDDESTSSLYGCFDPSTSGVPGWPARHLLARLRRKYPNKKEFCLACCRGDLRKSFVLTIKTDPVIFCEKATGWEKDAESLYKPRSVDLASVTDPTELATAAASLNLHLMRWRLLPSLDLEKLGKTSCLLLGAGTLGCQVARNLVGWGIRNITFVDNGLVSYSNPARQCLYTVKDAAERKKKAEAAALALFDVAPGTNKSPSNFRGIDLTIAMPGHSLFDEEDVLKLAHLVDSHDIVFILTDTREARWLPTVLASASPSKPTVINVGLGLDTYVVIRHGAKADLGCYFCNDVVAPGDSTKDRTLDQQCTVSRPGLAPLASAIATELAVSLLHHPLGHAAPATTDQKERDFGPLGIIPHSIRGFLTHFSSLAITTHKFKNCSACSESILTEYKTRGKDFIRDVATNPDLINDISGLADLAKGLGDFLLDDDDDDQDTLLS